MLLFFLYNLNSTSFWEEKTDEMLVFPEKLWRGILLFIFPFSPSLNLIFSRVSSVFLFFFSPFFSIFLRSHQNYLPLLFRQLTFHFLILKPVLISLVLFCTLFINFSLFRVLKIGSKWACRRYDWLLFFFNINEYLLKFQLASSERSRGAANCQR